MILDPPLDGKRDKIYTILKADVQKAKKFMEKENISVRQEFPPTTNSSNREAICVKKKVLPLFVQDAKDR